MVRNEAEKKLLINFEFQFASLTATYHQFAASFHSLTFKRIPNFWKLAGNLQKIPRVLGKYLELLSRVSETRIFRFDRFHDRAISFERSIYVHEATKIVY